MTPTNRDRSIDLGVVALAVALSIGISFALGEGLSLFPQPWGGLRPVERLDTLLPWPSDPHAEGRSVAALSCLLLWWRRRRPVAVAAALVVVCAFAPAVVPALIALFTVAVQRPLRTTLWVAALTLAPVPLYLLRHPRILTRLAVTEIAPVLLGCTLISASIGWGLFVRALNERAERAEAEAVLRAQRAQQQAREDIAREMHDVLAHRLSLLSVHAGALEFNPGASEGEVRRAASVIRESAHQALEDLQEVLQVLRTPVGEGQAAEPPQPTLGDVRRLVEESREAGVEVEVDERVTAAGSVPSVTGRTAYRIVQEALTNARKHAGDTPVRITLDGGPGTGLLLEVRNRMPRGGPPSRIPGTGQGLMGLAERAALVGGRLRYGPASDDFRLYAWLPWPP